MPFIGNQLAQSYISFAKQDFTTSATTAYTLDYPVANENEIALFINFVRQEPTTAYTASGTSLTLTSATSASDDMYAIFLGKAVQTVNPPAGSVGTSQLANGAVTSAKLDSGLALGKVLQVVTYKYEPVSTFSTTSSSFVNLGFSGSITPSSASNKIFISATFSVEQTVFSAVNLDRNGTLVSAKTNGLGAFQTQNLNLLQNISYLDSPNSTSSTTYTLFGRTTGTLYFLVNVTHSMTLMEIAG